MSSTRLPGWVRKKLTAVICALVITGGAALGQHFGWWQKARNIPPVAASGTYAVNHFVDGDTVAVNMDGVVEKVRFIGVDTPETHKPNTPVQCFGEMAAAHTKSLIGSNRVRLEADPKSTNRDRYDRLLRYVYLPDGTNVNESIIRDGFGFYYPYFPFTKSAEFAIAQSQAQAEHKGLWQVCQPTPTDKGGYVSNNA